MYMRLTPIDLPEEKKIRTLSHQISDPYGGNHYYTSHKTNSLASLPFPAGSGKEQLSVFFGKLI